MLRAMRRLRGTRLDIFGHAAVRREERQLIAWYKTLVEAVLDRLSPATHALAVEIAGLPDGIRGYEEIKLSNVVAVGKRAGELMRRLRAPVEPAHRDA
jgi:indolepyruvate ferredoxin oxidoreductase